MVTICTTCLTFNNSTFLPHFVFMRFVWIWEQTAIISLYNINWLVFIAETECVYCAVRTGYLNCIPVNISLHKDRGVVTSIVLRVPGTGSKQLDPWETDPVPIVENALGLVWTGAENLAPCRFRSPDHSARSESLYRLSCPGSHLYEQGDRNSEQSLTSTSIKSGGLA